MVDTHSGTCFRTSPKNVAAERDFNRIDVEGKPPDILEQALSPLEERAVQAIRNVNDTRAFPTDEDYNYIINLICLIAIRNPKFRKLINQAREQTVYIIEDMLMSDKKLWAHHVKKAQEAGFIAEVNVSFEKMKRSLERDKYRIEFSPESNLRLEFQNFGNLLSLLGERTWSLLIAPSSSYELICSDHPVVLTWKDSKRRGPVGYEVKNTAVFFPLGPRTGFYGVYEEPLPEVFTVKPVHVAMLNTLLVENAERHVFSAGDTFLCWYDSEMREIPCGDRVLPASETRWSK